MGTAQDNPAVEDATQKYGYQDVLIGPGANKDLFFISNTGQKSMLQKLRVWMYSGFFFGPILIVLGLAMVAIGILS
jgi:hypothetical protein